MLQLRDGQGAPVAVHRADYAAPAYWIDTVDLTFDLDPAKTRVLNKMTLRRTPAHTDRIRALRSRTRRLHQRNGP